MCCAVLLFLFLFFFLMGSCFGLGGRPAVDPPRTLDLHFVTLHSLRTLYLLHIRILSSHIP